MLFASMGDDNPLVDSFKIRVKDINFTNETVSEIKNLIIYMLRADVFIDVLIG